MKPQFACILMCLIFASCENQLLKTNGDDLPALPGNEFVLTADRVAQHPDVQFPSDSLTESDYTPLETNKIYNVAFSANGTAVTISDTISGTRISCSSSFSKYDINDGFFAGGRFLVWKSNDIYEAEITVYGSGVPIIRSERGELRKK